MLSHVPLHTSIYLSDMLWIHAPGEFHILRDVRYIYSLQQNYLLVIILSTFVRDPGVK